MIRLGQNIVITLRYVKGYLVSIFPTFHSSVNIWVKVICEISVLSHLEVAPVWGGIHETLLTCSGLKLCRLRFCHLLYGAFRVKDTSTPLVKTETHLS